MTAKYLIIIQTNIEGKGEYTVSGDGIALKDGTLWSLKHGNLSNGVHLEKLGRFVGDAHLKVGGLLDLDTCILCSDECLVGTFVSLVSV